MFHEEFDGYSPHHCVVEPQVCTETKLWEFEIMGTFMVENIMIQETYKPD